MAEFFNSDLRGFSIYADFNNLSTSEQITDSQWWQSSNNELVAIVKYLGDLLYNKIHITDVNGSNINYRRYFKHDHNGYF